MSEVGCGGQNDKTRATSWATESGKTVQNDQVHRPFRYVGQSERFGLSEERGVVLHIGNFGASVPNGCPVASKNGAPPNSALQTAVISMKTASKNTVKSELPDGIRRYHKTFKSVGGRTLECIFSLRKAASVSRSISPKILARAIGISESSLKRWSDDGVLSAVRTAGGHRRITLQESVRFIRAMNATLVRPDLLGLTDLAAIGPDWATSADVNVTMHAALEAGHAAEVRAMVQALYLGGWSPAAIFDGPMKWSMIEIGKLWLHAEWGIVVEHRATDICIQAINQLRFLAPPRTGSAPVAVGAAAEHDPYMLPTLMAATVVGECGFLDVNLGTITPPAVLINAAKHYQAKLVWVAASAAQDGKKTATDVTRIAAELRAQGTSVVVGGQSLAQVPSSELPGVVLAGSMTELAAFARGVMSGLKVTAEAGQNGPGQNGPGQNGPGPSGLGQITPG